MYRIEIPGFSVLSSSLFIRVNEYKKSSHAIINEYIPIENNPGLDNGRTILNKIPILLEPSIFADSSKLIGISSKNTLIIQIASGNAAVVNAIIKPILVFNNP